MIYGDLGETLLAPTPRIGCPRWRGPPTRATSARSPRTPSRWPSRATCPSTRTPRARRARSWTPTPSAWRERGADAIAQEAQTTADALEAWSERVGEERPELRETRRPDYMHARMALGSARTGGFGTVAGPLSDFLASVGAEADRLDIH